MFDHIQFHYQYDFSLMMMTWLLLLLIDSPVYVNHHLMIHVFVCDRRRSCLRMTEGKFYDDIRYLWMIAEELDNDIRYLWIVEELDNDTQYLWIVEELGDDILYLLL